MRKYSWIQKLGLSLVPSEFYIHVLQEKMIRAIGYMMLFILILSVSVGLYTGLQTKSAMDATSVDYESGRIPPVSIINSELFVDGNDTVTIEHFNTMIVLDDEYIYDINDVLAYENFVLFQKKGVSITSKGIGPIIYKYTDIFLFDLSSTDISTMLKTMAILMIPMSILSQLILSIISFFFNSIFILLVGNILRTVTGLGLRLKQVYHMVIYAMTFSVFWTHFTTLLPRPVPIWLDNFVYYAIPSMILISVFMIIRKRAVEEIHKKNDR